MLISFGKYKGQTVEQIAGTEQGRGYLEWLVSQPVKDDQWKDGNEERNAYIKTVLGNPPPDTPSPDQLGRSTPETDKEKTKQLALSLISQLTAIVRSW